MAAEKRSEEDILANLALLAQRKQAAEEAHRAGVMEALAQGLLKTDVADAAGVGRPLLYRWLDAAPEVARARQIALSQRTTGLTRESSSLAKGSPPQPLSTGAKKTARKDTKARAGKAASGA